MMPKTQWTETNTSAGTCHVRRSGPGRHHRRKVASAAVVAVLAGFSPVSSLRAADTVLLTEDFESYPLATNPTVIAAPNAFGVKTSTNTTAVVGSTPIGGTSGKVANLLDPGAGVSGGLEFNSGNAGYSAMVVSFELFSNATQAANQSLNISLTGWNTAVGSQGSGSNRRLAQIQFDQFNTATPGFFVKTGGTANTTHFSGTYVAANKQTVKIYANDHDTAAINYNGPDSVHRSLPANSFAVFLNNGIVTMSNSLVYAPLSLTAVDATTLATLTGNANLGRFGFTTSTAGAGNWLIENVVISEMDPNAQPPNLPPVVTSATTATGFINVPFSYQIVAANATSFGLTGTLPDGLVFNTGTGLIAGTPTTLGGPTTVVLTATNAQSQVSAPVNLDITIASPINTFTGSNSSLNNTASWSVTASPTASTSVGSFLDLTLASSVTSLTTSSGNVYAKSWNSTNGGSYSVSSLSAGTTAFRMGNTSSGADTTPFDNLVSGVQNDLVYLSGGSDLTFPPANPTSPATPPTVELRNSGNFNIGSGSILDVQTVITDASSRALTKTGVGTAILGGANSYRGGTTLSAGTLTLAGSASPTRNAQAKAIVTGGVVTGYTVIDGGAGYTVAPTVTIGKNTGEGTVVTATATATISGGVVTAINVVVGGSGYLVAPKVQIYSNQSPLGTGAVTLAAGTLSATVDADLSRITDYPDATNAFFRLSGTNTTVNGPITINVADTRTVNAYTLAGNGDSANLITKNGLGTLWLRGSGATSLSGGWSIDAGTLFVGTSSSQGLGTGTLTLNGGNLRFSKGVSSTGTYTGHGQDAPLEVLQHTTITLDANPLSPSGSNTVSFPSLAIGTKTIHLVKSATAKSSADLGFVDPTLSFQAATLSGVATMDVGALTNLSLQAATGSGAGLTKTGSGRLALGDNLTGATATATQSAGSVDSLTLTLPGSGYVVPPTVTISAPVAGVTATATANLTGGTVTGLTITNAGSGYTTAPTVTFSAPKTGIPNSYTGATLVNAGTLALSGSHASPITVLSTAVLESTLDELGVPMAISSSSLALVSGSKVRIIGTPVAASYTLLVASSITGTPVLETAIPGYALVVESNSLKLNAAATGYSTWAGTHAGGQTADLDYDKDGVANGVEYFMGQTGSTFTPNPGVVGGTVSWPRDPSAVATFKVQISDTLATGGWTDIVPPHAGINTANPNQVVYTLPTGAAKKFCRLVVTP
jgi:autotransporter-associated beta strand protein